MPAHRPYTKSAAKHVTADAVPPGAGDLRREFGRVDPRMVTFQVRPEQRQAVRQDAELGDPDPQEPGTEAVLPGAQFLTVCCPGGGSAPESTVSNNPWSHAKPLLPLCRDGAQRPRDGSNNGSCVIYRVDLKRGPLLGAYDPGAEMGLQWSAVFAVALH